MRFRQKLAWLQLATAALWVFSSSLWFIRHPATAIGRAYLLTGTIWLSMGIFHIATYLFSWWKIHDTTLEIHHLGGSKGIPWNEVTYVGPWRIGKNPPHRDTIQVDYYRQAPLSDRGTLIFTPSKDARTALLDNLRTHAPQATFDL